MSESVSQHLQDFADLMVDELIATVRDQLERGIGLSVDDQKHMLEQLVTDRDRRFAALSRPSPSPVTELEGLVKWLSGEADGRHRQAAQAITQLLAEKARLRDALEAILHEQTRPLEAGEGRATSGVVIRLARTALNNDKGNGE